MNKLVVLTYPDQSKIDEAIRTLRKLHADRSNELYASAVVLKSADRKLSVQDITKEGHGGTAVAALIGALAGLPAGPAAAVIMATGGAVIGNAADMSSEDDFNEFATNIADSVAAGGAAVVAEVGDEGVTAFTTAMQGLGGTVLHS